MNIQDTNTIKKPEAIKRLFTAIQSYMPENKREAYLQDLHMTQEELIERIKGNVC